MTASEKTEAKYELIPVPTCSDVYSFEGEIRIDGKIIGHTYKAAEDREMPWSVLLFPNDKLGMGGAGVGKTYFDALLDAFESCIRIINHTVNQFNKFSTEHKTGLSGIKPEE